jgi:hypothetical protein
MDLIAAMMAIKIADSYQQSYPQLRGWSSRILTHSASMGA